MALMSWPVTPTNLLRGDHCGGHLRRAMGRIGVVQEMSREALKNFLRAVEHHQGLRRDAARCSDDDQLLALAHRHGFKVIHQDLRNDARESAITRWFETSRIQRSFRSPPFQSTPSQSPSS